MDTKRRVANPQVPELLVEIEAIGVLSSAPRYKLIGAQLAGALGLNPLPVVSPRAR